MSEKTAKFKELVEKYFGLDILTKKYDYNGSNFSGWTQVEDETLYLLDQNFECSCCTLHIIPLMSLEKLLEMVIAEYPESYYTIGKITMAIRGEFSIEDIIVDLFEERLEDVINAYDDDNYYVCGTTFNYNTGQSEFEF